MSDEFGQSDEEYQAKIREILDYVEKHGEKSRKERWEDSE